MFSMFVVTNCFLFRNSKIRKSVKRTYEKGTIGGNELSSSSKIQGQNEQKNSSQNSRIKIKDSDLRTKKIINENPFAKNFFQDTKNREWMK